MGSGASVEKQPIQGNSSKSGNLLNNGKDAMKILIVGEPKCGKTAVFLRYVRNQFYTAYWPTMEPQIETVVKKVNVPSAEIVSIQLWDIPGDEDIDLFYQYCKDVDAAIVVADLNQPQEINKAVAWKQRVFNNLEFSDTPSVTTEDKTEDKTEEKTDVNSEEQEKDSNCEFDLEERKNQVAFLLVGSKLDLVQRSEPTIKSIDTTDQSEDLKTQTTVEQTKVEEKQPINARSKIDTGLRKKKTTKNQTSSGKQTTVKHSETGVSEVKEASDNSAINACEKDDQTSPSKDSNEAPVVNALRSLGEENGFVSTVLVSASCGDHSVHTAVQYVVRHIVQQRLAKARSEQKSVSDEKARESDKLLTHCGLEEFDELFDKCTLPLRWTHEYKTCCDMTMNRLQASCVSAEIVDNTASLQDCVHALNQALDITVVDDEPFISLSLKSTTDEETVDKRLKEALDCFNKEYAAVRKSVLTDGPTVDLTLRKLDCRISARADTAWEQMATERGLDHRQVLPVIEKNRARLLDASQLLEKKLEECINEVTQIRTAMLW